jgi:acyl carrier protein phosphodiesterase
MNWLAHLYLAEEPLPCRLGNLLADVIKGPARRTVNSLIQRGLACHRLIDRFTDAHQLVWQSQQQLSERWARFRGILIDIYYDHLLAKTWNEYHPQQLSEFVHDFYRLAGDCVQTLPQFAGEVLQSIIRVDRLGSYATLDGIEDAMARLSIRITERVGKTIRLQDALPELVAQESALMVDFQQFFPQLTQHIRKWCAAQEPCGI